jgi:FkbM family methyltransferase
MPAWMNSLVKRTKVVKDLHVKLKMTQAMLSRVVTADAPVLLPDGSRLLVPNCVEDGIQRDIFCSQDYFEAELLRDLEAKLPSAGVFADVGANIGNHSIFWASRGSRSVHAFEPMPSTFALLQKNISLNRFADRIHAHNVGLGDREGRASVKKFTSENIGATEIVENPSGGMILSRLDDFAGELGSLDFLKIDTEGFELKVLRGAAQTLMNFAPIILVEITRKNKAAVFRLLLAAGYALTMEYPEYNYLFEPLNRRLPTT